MFDFLKKKITTFVNKITGKEEKEDAGKIEAWADEAKPLEEKPLEEKTEAKVEETPSVSLKKNEEKKEEIKPETPKEICAAAAPKYTDEKTVLKKEKPKIEHKTAKKEEKIRPSLSIATTIKSILSNEIEIKKEDIKNMLDSLELDLIEADVEMDTAARIISEIERRLLGRKVEKSKLNNFIKEEIRATLSSAMTTGKEFSLFEKIREGPRPFVVVFFGTNGSGKTTTMAKIAHLLINNKLSVVFAAADTFRAAAIEQLKVHAERLSIRVINKDYGSDPASVIFDTINYAKAHNIDVVLVDTAGRQETNTNLMNELKKINRVIKPHLKIYIAESIGGSAVLEQIKSFNSEIGVDGIILTKLDCDAKGGTILSVANVTAVPVLMLGTGQKYAALEDFDSEKIAARIIE